ncbi:hypothetical protein GYA49_04830 [Candidatus Beckwithbacteria bacterium]|nr:hypothetical protein [Candidatus Beckwithbacteria bacterium]
MFKIKIWQFFLATFLLTFILFYPALNTFNTHDDFFHFNISRAENFKTFLDFFNPTKTIDGWNFYRPLSTQAFYFLIATVFTYNAFGAHLLLFLLFFALLGLVFFFFKEFTKDKSIAFLATFFYGISASHFAHIYFVGSQEIIHGLCYLTALLFWTKFVKSSRLVFFYFTLVATILALTAKEFAITLPFLMIGIYIWFNLQKESRLKFKHIFLALVPLFILVAIYGYIKIIFQNPAGSDSYLLYFSPRILANSLAWYGLWALNLPEMLVDFISFDGSINPNLWLFWSKQIIPIFTLFGLSFLILIWQFIQACRRQKTQTLHLLAFCVLEFTIYLAPVLFLPWHKFAMYLTIPLLFVSLFVAQLFSIQNTKKSLIATFLIVNLLLSWSTLQLTHQTHWISQGAQTARKVYNFMNQNYKDKAATIAFYDQKTDLDLPWLPSQQLKVILSDQNFFKVFYDGTIKAQYLTVDEVASSTAAIKIPARQFLGY